MVSTKMGHRGGLPRAALAALVAAAACSDPPAPTAPGTLRQDVAASVSEREFGTPTYARFTLDLRVVGDLRPNGAIRVAAVARGLVSTEDVEIRITLPEVAAARLTGWDAGTYHMPVGVALGTEGAWRTPLRAGQEVRREVALEIPRPGYYLVTAVILKKSGEPIVGREGLYADVAV